MLKRFPPGYRTDRELRDLHLAGLRWTVGHAWNNSPFYRKRLDESGVSPGSILSLEDLGRIPFTTADDLRALGVAAVADLRAMDPQDLTTRAPATGYMPWGTIDGEVLPEIAPDLVEETR